MKIRTRPKTHATTALGLASTLLVVSACSDEPTAPGGDEPAALLSVQPSPGSTDVTVGSSVVVTFDHAIADGMEEYAALHEGDVTGPGVPGMWLISDDATTLTFTPDEPLKPATTYVIHVGGGMMDDHGNVVDLEDHGLAMGGQWATESMMTGGMGPGMMGGGEPGQHMGEGWQHPANGSYGMVFTFTTAG
jgi:hypothetical protein